MSWRTTIGAVTVLVASLGLSTAAQADHVAELGPGEHGFLEAGECYVGPEAFGIPDRGVGGEYFGVALRTTDVKRHVVKDGRTMAYTCRFSDVPTRLEAATNPYLVEDYTVPKGGFRAYVSCWDRYNPGMVEGSGTIRISHRGTAMLKCDLREAYAELDAQRG